MKNKFDIHGETTVIYIVRKNGDEYKVLVDTKSLELIHHSYPGSWSLRHSKDTGKFYVCGSVMHENYSGHPYLHRVIMNAPRNMKVDHINHEPLDNRSSNLRIVTDSQNLLNRTGAQKNNINTGVRNVAAVNSKFKVRMNIRGKSLTFGAYDDLETAKKVAYYIQKNIMDIS